MRGRRERIGLGGAGWATDGAPVSCHGSDFMSGRLWWKKQRHWPLMLSTAQWMVPALDVRRRYVIERITDWKICFSRIVVVVLFNLVLLKLKRNLGFPHRQHQVISISIVPAVRLIITL